MSKISKPLALLLACCTSAAGFSSAALAAGPAPQASPQSVLNAPDARERSRLEELFIWRTSEELRLAPAEEAKFTEAIHALNMRRRAANAKMDEALRVLASAKSKAESEKALAAHRAALREMQSVANAELDKLKPLLDAQKLAQYLVVKNSILEKLKEMLAAPAQTQAAAKPAVSAGANVASPSAASGAGPATEAAAPSVAHGSGTASGMTAPAAQQK